LIVENGDLVTEEYSRLRELGGLGCVTPEKKLRCGKKSGHREEEKKKKIKKQTKCLSGKEKDRRQNQKIQEKNGKG